MAYEYESVVWSSKTPMTWDKLAQMQENMDYLKAQIDGNIAYIQGTSRGIGKGLLHLQAITWIINLPPNQFVAIGNSFTPQTEAGRLYKFTAYAPRLHLYNGAALLRLYKDGVMLQQAISSVYSPGNANNNTAVCYLSPGTNTTSVYKVECMALWGDPGSQFWCSGDTPGYITFEDVGPSV